MLVLSRRVDDLILFPDLGISIEILRLKGNSVRVGIDAPIEIKVLRGELDDEANTQHFELTGKNEHDVRDKLNALNVAFAFAKKLIECGEYNLAATKLHSALSQIQDKSTELPEHLSAENGVSALLVEDVDNEREMLAGFLRLHGIQVTSVADGESAAEQLESSPAPDFMMVDIGLPGKSGADLILDIRSNPSFDGVKLFAISGQTPQQAGINPVESRIAKWFQKPLKPNHLISEIEQTIQPKPSKSLNDAISASAS